MHLYTHIQNRRYRARIYYDPLAENPSTQDTTLGTVVSWHPLGEAHGYASPTDFLAQVPEDTVVRLPVYLYEHGGRRLSTRPFRDPWDSGLIGWIFADLSTVCDYFGAVEFTPELRARAVRALQDEIATLSAYLNGDVFGYVLERAVPCACDPDCDHPPTYVVEDEAWGFYGTDFFANAMTSYLSHAFPEYTYRNLPASA